MYLWKFQIFLTSLTQLKASQWPTNGSWPTDEAKYPSNAPIGPSKVSEVQRSLQGCEEGIHSDQGVPTKSFAYSIRRKANKYTVERAGVKR